MKAWVQAARKVNARAGTLAFRLPSILIDSRWWTGPVSVAGGDG